MKLDLIEHGVSEFNLSISWIIIQPFCVQFVLLNVIMSYNFWFLKWIATTANTLLLN